jgi:hypothetical protein
MEEGQKIGQDNKQTGLEVAAEEEANNNKCVLQSSVLRDLH